jgi:hypothetical protein
MIFVRLISTCRFAGLSSIIVALRVEFNFAIHKTNKDLEKVKILTYGTLLFSSYPLE